MSKRQGGNEDEDLKTPKRSDTMTSTVTQHSTFSGPHRTDTILTQATTVTHLSEESVDTQVSDTWGPGDDARVAAQARRDSSAPSLSPAPRTQTSSGGGSNSSGSVLGRSYQLPPGPPDGHDDPLEDEEEEADERTQDVGYDSEGETGSDDQTRR
ncbi:hypothetical protein BD324DRAFT_681765 [Kockovaella imperatae]|uniref:Uncharacterized protein n=1 Tax=Kockovaella imperatae TaxID=4999 RepID=A0A1Y1UDY6_9TREE|nr:hypothetical protein BD324DRAFT_681765 [Kockovaella imperatae]ORX36258.1 hypothetical protein BD324DRAFT_681765 [Kockovaella imperatae]